MAKQVFTKDPEAKLDYVIDWTELLSSDDNIESVEWNVPAGLVLDELQSSHTDKTATAWISGGSPGTSYNVECKVTTTGGRIDERSFRIIVREL